MEMVTNSHGTQVTIDGDNVDNMNTLVRQVAYLNTREFPAPGRRRLEMETKITCGDGTRLQVSIPILKVGVTNRLRKNQFLKCIQELYIKLLNIANNTASGPLCPVQYPGAANPTANHLHQRYREHVQGV